MKQVVIEIPDDKDVQWIDNVLTLVDKKPKVKIKTYDDLIKNKVKISGYCLSSTGIQEYKGPALDFNRNLAASEKVAKSMLAMAQISQLMPYYGGEVTNDKWENSDIDKYIIRALGNKINTDLYNRTHYFLAFHTEEQRDEFLKNNEQLVKDYLMLD